MLRLNNISKYFTGVKALQNVTLHFEKGIIHALCGENGAGKSTLMNIIMGIHQPDEGIILWNEQPVEIRNVQTAHQMGISIVYQERSLVDSLSIAENIYPVQTPVVKVGLIDFQLLFRQAQQLLNELGLTNLSPMTLVKKLSTAQKQMIEIAKAIAKTPSLLILDEPTASLTHSETEILFRILKNLKEKGVGIIYISHRMSELQKISDIISVLKDGKFVATIDSKTPAQEIVRLMVGRDLESVKKSTNVQMEIKLEVENIQGKGFRNISFKLLKGEILGFAGLQGSGRSAMARSLFGDEKITGGKILKDGKVLHLNHPSEAIDHGIVYLPEDRKAEGLFLHLSISENIFSAQLKKGFYNAAIADDVTLKLCKLFSIRTTTVRQHLRKLSGGNQQKVMLAKWLAQEPEIIIVNEPTHGIDISSKEEIYQLLKYMTAEGKSILLISSELPELLFLSDRIAVMHEKEIIGILSREEATEERIAALASGINAH
ncbi:MAG: sugar ABC transporter ATP-binding protein [Chitinophagaceae bacterium]|nr:sugar ABC transporter ATP-binding protein [Chitinophagaceae bacterium]